MFTDEMGIDSTIQLALANLYLNKPLLELITFDDGDPLEGSSSTSIDVNLGLDIDEEEGEHNSSVGDLDDDYEMREDEM